jgi:branched-chain amino acid transport system substrate-binding protein
MKVINMLITRRAMAQKLGATALLAAPMFIKAQSSTDEVVLGQSAPLSGPAADLGNQFRAGAMAAFKDINSNGGAGGRKIRLITKDDGYEPARTSANTTQLIESDRVFSLFGYIGTPTSKAALPIFSKAGVPFFAPFTGAESLRNPFNPLIWHVRASYYEEAESLVAQMLASGIQQIAVFYQNDAFGQEGLEGVRRALERRGLSPKATATVERNSTDVKTAVDTLNNAQPGGIVMISAYASVAAFIQNWRARSLTNQTVALRAVSFVGANALARSLGEDAKGVGVSQVVPFPYDARRSPVAASYVNAAKQQGDAVTFGGLEGYIAAKTFAAALRQVNGKLTRDKFLDAMKTLNSLDLGGFPLSYGSKQNSGSSFVEVVAIRNAQSFMR